MVFFTFLWTIAVLTFHFGQPYPGFWSNMIFMGFVLTFTIWNCLILVIGFQYLFGFFVPDVGLVFIFFLFCMVSFPLLPFNIIIPQYSIYHMYKNIVPPGSDFKRNLIEVRDCVLNLFEAIIFTLVSAAISQIVNFFDGSKIIGFRFKNYGC